MFSIFPETALKRKVRRGSEKEEQQSFFYLFWNQSINHVFIDAYDKAHPAT